MTIKEMLYEIFLLFVFSGSLVIGVLSLVLGISGMFLMDYTILALLFSVALASMIVAFVSATALYGKHTK